MTAPQLFELFEGEYSQYLLVTLSGGQKENGKRNAEYTTVYKTVTEELWQKHLNGEILIGIKPETNGKAKWGCIDVDPSSYTGFNEKKFTDIVKEYNLPLIPVRSKSGGLHLFLFLKDWADVKDIRKVLDKWNNKYFMSKEVFPCNKSVGMPYHKESRAVEYAYGEQGQGILVGAFVELAYKRRFKIEELLEFKTGKYEPEEGWNDFPPCIQRLLTDKWTGDNRNNILFNVGVLEMKKSEGNLDKKDLKEILLERNKQIFAEPLTEKEITGTVVQSVFKNTYSYKCPPKHGYMTPICNKQLCQLRKLGVGAQAPDIIDQFKNIKFSKDTKGTVWSFEYNDTQITVTPEDMKDEKAFRTRLLYYNIYWMTLPKPKKGPPPFELLMKAILSNAKEDENMKYEDSVEETRYTVLKQFFESFMTQDNFEKLKDGYIIVEKDKDTNKDYCYFKKNTLDKFLKKSNKDFSNSNEAIKILKCERLDYYKNEKNVWKVEMPDFVKNEKQTMPQTTTAQQPLTELDESYHTGQFRTPKA